MKNVRTCHLATLVVMGTAAVVTLAGWSGVAQAAEAFPSRPLRIVVPYAPGGSTDPIARLVGQQLTETLKQPVVVENRAGGGTMIGTELVQKSPADGYTMLLASSSHAVNPALYKKVNYDPVKDFQAVSLAMSFPLLLTVNPNVPVNSVKELVAQSQASPGKFAYASGGNGAANHLAGEMFKALANVDLLHVPYKGGGPALADHLGGQVPLMFGSIVQSLQQVKAGKLRALGVSGGTRSPLSPDIPTIGEAGVAGYNVTSWNAFVVPAATPAPVVAALNVEIVRALRLPSTRESLASQGAEPTPTTAREAQDFIAAEVVRWARLVEKQGIHVD